MNNKWNQYAQKQMRAADDKPDTTKLIKIINLLRPMFPFVTYKRDHFLLFNFMTAKFIDVKEDLTESDLKENFWHRADIVMVYRNKFLIVEVDGDVHEVKTKKTIERNEDYTRADLNFIVVNEAELKLKLGFQKSYKLTPEQIADEIITKIKKEDRLPMA